MFLPETDIETKIFKTTDHLQVANTLAHIAQQWSKLKDYNEAQRQFQMVLGKKNKTQEKFEARFCKSLWLRLEKERKKNH